MGNVFYYPPKGGEPCPLHFKELIWRRRLLNSGRDTSAESSGLAGVVRHSSIVGSDRQSVQLSQQTYANTGIILLFVCPLISCIQAKIVLHSVYCCVYGTRWSIKISR